jgi:hypothetical protein
VVVKPVVVHKIGTDDNLGGLMFAHEITDEIKNTLDDITHMDYEEFSDGGSLYFSNYNGYVELQEGIFYFNWDTLEFKVIKWHIEDEKKKLNIINDMTEVFEYHEQCRFERMRR